jgi:hypothetical protein
MVGTDLPSKEMTFCYHLLDDPDLHFQEIEGVSSLFALGQDVAVYLLDRSSVHFFLEYNE